MKTENYFHAPNGGTLYIGICRDCVEIDTRRENAGGRSKFGPSANLTFTQARALRDWLVRNVPEEAIEERTFETQFRFLDAVDILTELFPDQTKTQIMIALEQSTIGELRNGWLDYARFAHAQKKLAIISGKDVAE